MNFNPSCQLYLVNQRSPVRIAFQQHTAPQFWILPAYQIAGKTFEEGILIANLNKILKINFNVRSKDFLKLTLLLKVISYHLLYDYCFLGEKNPLFLHIILKTLQASILFYWYLCTSTACFNYRGFVMCFNIRQVQFTFLTFFSVFYQLFLCLFFHVYMHTHIFVCI